MKPLEVLVAGVEGWRPGREETGERVFFGAEADVVVAARAARARQTRGRICPGRG
jgi:hypothetical protein